MAGGCFVERSVLVPGIVELQLTDLGWTGYEVLPGIISRTSGIDSLVLSFLPASLCIISGLEDGHFLVH